MDSMRESVPAGASGASAGGVKRAEGACVVGPRWAQASAGGWESAGCWVAALTRRGVVVRDGAQPGEPAGYSLAVADAARGIYGSADAGSGVAW
jgi:hypothetical protein